MCRQRWPHLAAIYSVCNIASRVADFLLHTSDTHTHIEWGGMGVGEPISYRIFSCRSRNDVHRVYMLRLEIFNKATSFSSCLHCCVVSCLALSSSLAKQWRIPSTSYMANLLPPPPNMSNKRTHSSDAIIISQQMLQRSITLCAIYIYRFLLCL